MLNLTRRWELDSISIVFWRVQQLLAINRREFVSLWGRVAPEVSKLRYGASISGLSFLRLHIDMRSILQISLASSLHV